MQLDANKYRQTFFEEAAEHVANLEGAVLRLDAGEPAPDAVDEAFRAAHSIKGGADAVGFPQIARFTHAIETLLGSLRGPRRAVPGRVTDLLLQSSDALAGMVFAVRNNGPIPPGIDDLHTRLLECVRPGDGSRLREYLVRVTPHPDAYRSGLDPMSVLPEFERIGKILAVRSLTDSIPKIAELDPERCLLGWEIRLQSEKTSTEIEEAFAFAGDNIALDLDPVSESAPQAPQTPVGKQPLPRESLVDQPHGRDPVRFGTFLVSRKMVTPEQVLAALDRQATSRKTVGRLAVQTGLMTVAQLFDCLGKLSPGETLGEAAIRLGVLTEADLGRLLLLQSRGVPSLAEVLLASKVLEPHVLAAEQQAFLAETGTTPELDESLCEVTPPARRASVCEGNEALVAENAEMLGEFCAEAGEHLEAADGHLLALDGNPNDRDALNAVYRGFHTIKGVSSMLHLEAIRSLAHETETLLNLARDGKITLSGAIMDLVFAATDAMKKQVDFVRDWIANRGKLATDQNLTRLLSALARAASGEQPDRSPSPEPVSQPVPEPAAQQEPDQATPRRPGPGDKDTVRVDRSRLDKLINTIGELVIAQSMARQEYDEHVGDGFLSVALPEVDKISRELQELSLSLRMVPLAGTFQKMTRLVRDVSKKLGKPVHLELQGEDTELDKTVVDQLGDPLMHMVRNSLDHGLELPAERIAAGKPAEGHVTLKAYHQGGNVYLEIKDDGRGLNRDVISRKAIEKGIITEATRLTDAEVYALIFEPGFSTAKQVTDVSGRGVGMDVVRRNVEALQGSILIRTQVGKGTTFTIRLPLTLAIVDGLMVGVSDDVYVVPLLSVVESFRPNRTDVHLLAGLGEVVSVRGETVPILRLCDVLRRPGRISNPCEGLLVLVEDQGKKQAVLVDELLGQSAVVVKSLDVNYQKVDGIAGATILSDGRVAMILDIPGLTRLPKPRTTIPRELREPVLEHSVVGGGHL